MIYAKQIFYRDSLLAVKVELVWSITNPHLPVHDQKCIFSDVMASLSEYFLPEHHQKLWYSKPTSI